MSESTKYQEVFSHERPRYLAMACLARVRVPCDRRFQIICQADSLPYLKQILKGSVLVIVSLDHQLWPESGWIQRELGKETNKMPGLSKFIFGSDGFRFQHMSFRFFFAAS